MAQQRRIAQRRIGVFSQLAAPTRDETTHESWEPTQSFDGMDGYPPVTPQGVGSGGPRRRIASRGALVAVAVCAGLCIVALTVGLVFRASFNGKLYDNVYVNDQNIGGMTPENARTALSQSLDSAVGSTITLKSDTKQWTPKRTELGMRVDLDRTVDEAYAAGRDGGPLSQMWRAFEMRQGAKAYVPLYVQVDDQVLNSYLDGLQTQLGTPPKDASVSVKGKEIVVSPGTDGVKLDRDVLRQQLLDTTAHLRPTSLTLPVTFASPTVTTAQMDQAKARAEALVGSSLSLTFNEKKWDLTHDDLIGALRFTPTFDPKIDAAGLNPRILAIAGELKQAPKDAEIGWDNQLVVRQPAKNGQRLNVEQTLALINAWTGDVRMIALPVEVQKPRITDDVGALGITTRIARGISNFSGSDAARAHNIGVASQYLDNTVIAPGEVFSFLDAIGDISTARGYKDGYVILAEQTVPGVGGGVCQVATTMFRAAMYSGLPIEERNPHAYIVSYYQQGGYPLGLDAAVFSPGVDMKFRNETDKYMIVKTAIDSGNLYISIYGPDLGYKVDLSDPTITNKKPAPDDEYEVDPKLPAGSKKQVEFAKGGEDVAITRIVHSADGKVVRQASFNTHYQAWPNKFLVSKDMAPNALKPTTAPNTPAPGSPTKPAQETPVATLPAKPQATLTTAPKPATTAVPTKKP